ncbi:MAG TPA: biopolymer transporter ExbD [Polyangiaceae bacterium]|jgi:biopolymer transport protein ExbD
MAGAAEEEESTIYGINVTPLVDVMMVLLIIMMVTARIIVAQGMPMKLPEAASTNVVPKMFSVDITKDGHTYVEKKLVKDGESLLRLAADARRKNEDVRAIIRADAKTLHREVIHVLDILRQAGIAKIAFAVTPVGERSTKD